MVERGPATRLEQLCDTGARLQPEGAPVDVGRGGDLMAADASDGVAQTLQVGEADVKGKPA